MMACDKQWWKAKSVSKGIPSLMITSFLAIQHINNNINFFNSKRPLSVTQLWKTYTRTLQKKS